MKYVSLFAGIGGFDHALDELGHEKVFVSEWDKYAQQSYLSFFGGEVHGDITKIPAMNVPDHDVLVGGFPCQAFSVAGHRKGLEDTRGTLFFEIARIAKEKKPERLLLENVKGLISHDKGKTLDLMIKTLWEIGYHIDFTVLNSKFYDVPQNRERIFFVAVRDDLALPVQWRNFRKNVVGKAKKRISEMDGAKLINFPFPTNDTVRLRLIDILETQVDEKYYLSDEKTAALVAQLEEKDRVSGCVGHHPFSKKQEFKGYNSDISPALIATDYKAPKTLLEDENELPSSISEPEIHGLPIKEATKKGFVIAEIGDSVNLRFPESKTRRGRVGKQLANTLEATSINQGVLVVGSLDHYANDQMNRVYSPEGVAPTLTVPSGGGREQKVLEVRPVLTPDRMDKRQNGRRFKEDGEEMFTLTGQDRHGVALARKESAAKKRYRIRKLTPLECWRLQSFPDAAFWAAKNAGVSDSQLYRQAGNAVTVNVVKSIMENAEKYRDSYMKS